MTFGRSWPTPASPVTVPTRPGARPSCASTAQTVPSPTGAATTPSSPASPNRASSTGASPPDEGRAHAAGLRQSPTQPPQKSPCCGAGSNREPRGRTLALLPPRQLPPPKVKDAAWLRNRIDAFILARLERQGLTPSPEADRTTLLRRVTLDLTGLPPTPAEVDAFLADPSPDAYEKVVDRLLASPRYRRAHGHALARRRPLRRHQRLPERRRTLHVALARLGDRRLQPQHAVRPLHRRAACRRPAAEPDAGTADRHRLQPQPSRQRRGRHHPRGVCASSTSSTAWTPRPPSGWA